MVGPFENRTLRLEQSDVLVTQIKPADIAIVLATDGVWDMVTKEKVGSIIFNNFKTKNAEDAANTIVRLAAERF